jgi:hypothetical protein
MAIRQINLKLVSWIAVIILLTPLRLFAATESYNNYIAGTQVRANNWFLVTDPKWNVTPGSSYVNYKITDVLKLTFDKSSLRFYSKYFNVRVKFQVTLYRSAIDSVKDTFTLKIEYNPGQHTNYNDLSAKRYHGGQRMKVSIMSIQSSMGSVPTNLYVEGDVISERYYTLNCSSFPDSLRSTYLPTTDELQLSWKAISGAEAYDVEWTYISDADLDNNNNLKLTASSHLNWNFDNNATRVTTTGNVYKISMIFPRGYIAYRVRAIGKKPPNLDVGYNCTWTSDTSATHILSRYLHKYLVDSTHAHEPLLNWTYEADFAEEAKKKEIVNYFDGSDRKRQTVTRSNSNYQAIVQENIYDYYGRQAVQVMPVPANSGIIHYFENFNRNQSHLAYSPADFKGISCDTPGAAVMDSTTTGAARYYSQLNNFLALPEISYVPKAFGYPFIQTEFMPDNTGRVSRMSGTGVTHKIGSNHETQYIYGVPDAAELDRLFGSEIGFASHYKKIIGIDANGQANLTYKDMSDNVIATALTGNIPSNLKVADSGSTWINENLMSKSTYDTLNQKLTITDAIAVASPTTYTIKYSLNTANYRACGMDNFCDDCVYDLSIKLSNKCRSFYTFDTIIGRTSPYDTAVHRLFPDSGFKKITLTLQPGSYVLNKTLSINQAALDSYTTIYFDTARCLRTQTQYINTSLSKIKSTDCISKTSSAQPSFASPCQGAYEMMLQDVCPGGQYATRHSPLIASDSMSILADSSILPASYRIGISANWKHPALPYLDEYGHADFVTVNGVKYRPQDLTRNQFKLYFKRSWAKALVQYHPEYAYYQYCLEHSASQIWTDSLFAINTYDEARSRGIIKDTLDKDPLFNHFHDTGYIVTLISRARDSINSNARRYMHVGTHWYSIWYIAATNAVCPKTGGCFSYTDAPSTILYKMEHEDSCFKNVFWQTFRALYLALKQKHENDLQQNYAILHRGYAGCIGLNRQPLWQLWYGFNCYPYVLSYPLCGFSYPFHYSGKDDIKATCYEPDSGIYRTKIARFGNWSSVMGFDVYSPPSTKKNDVKDSLNKGCYRHCLGNVPTWWRKLSGCKRSYKISGADSTSIINAMLAICDSGCDRNHPFGASTLSDQKTSISCGSCTNIRTFDDILRCKFGPAYKSDICDGTLLSNPPSFNNNSDGLPAYVTTLDQCGCDKIMHVDSLFNHVSVGLRPPGVKNPNDWMKSLYHVGVWDFQKLKCDCRDAWNMSYPSIWSSTKPWLKPSIDKLKSDSLVVPTQLTCTPPMNKPGGCITYATLEDTLNSFHRRNPTVLGSPYYNILLTNYLNNAFGLSLNYSDYKKFLQTCQVLAQDTIVNCGLRTTQAADLEVFIKKLFDTTRTHIYKDTFLITRGGTVDSILNGSLYPSTLKRDSCKPRYKPVSIFKNKLIAEVYDSCGFNCYLTLSLPDTSKKIKWLRFGASPNLRADTPHTAGVHYNFLMTGTYFGSPITVRGVTSCYPINYCDKVVTTVNMCYPEIIRVIKPNASKFPRIRLDTCSCNKIVEMYNIVKLDASIWDTTTFNHYAVEAKFDSVFRSRYGFFREYYLNNLTDCRKGVISDMFHHGQHLDTIGTGYTRFLRTNWSNYSIGVINADTFTVPSFLGCPNCTDCSTMEAAVNTYYETFNGAIRKGNFTDDLQAYLKSVKGQPLKVAAATGSAPPGCTNCNGSSVFVCDSINQTGYDLGVFLDSLSRYKKLKVTSTPRLLNGALPYDSVFIYSELNQFPAAHHRTYFTYDSGSNYLRSKIDYYNSHDTLLGECQFSLTSTGTFPDSIKSFNHICIDPHNAGDNHYFTIIAYNRHTLTPVTLNGYIGCYSLASCCYFDKRKLCNKLPDYTPMDTDDCMAKLRLIATDLGKRNYQAYRDSIRDAFRFNYIQQCMSKAKEGLSLQYRYNTFHFTLFYYDAAGTRIKTVPPGGVHPITRKTALDSIARLRSQVNAPQIIPLHTLITYHQYNTLNNPIQTITPDGGMVQTWYDRLGRHALTQNAKQSPAKRYAYTKYDALGRSIEVGEVLNTRTSTVNHDSLRNDSKLQSFIANGIRSEITQTFYDAPMKDTINLYAFGNDHQQNLRGRVSSIIYKDKNIAAYNYATHYSYDKHGNVKTLIQEFPELYNMGYEYFRMDYQYDLLSGKVNEVSYQKGRPDQFFHKYDYDADNRIVDVWTSRDSVIWDRDADYLYYLHGPLAREELGEMRVQGMDYAYTIQGWLKGVNSNTLKAWRDMGQDGRITYPMHNMVARDAYGFSIGYFYNDYSSIGNSTFEAKIRTGSPVLIPTTLDLASPGLYNGNIRHIVTATSLFGVQGMAYQYDQLNRLRQADAYRSIDIINNAWQTGSPIPNPEYKEAFTYDQNGNMKSLIRRGVFPNLAMDSLTFFSYAGTNRLRYITDGVNSGNYTDDIDNQIDTNYKWDAIGQMIYARQDSILAMDWSLYNKMTSIIRTPGCKKANLSYRYGADQMRVRQLSKDNDSIGHWNYTYYVRDAQGNIMATYNRKLKDLHVLKTGDCENVLKVFDTLVGHTNYRHFFSAHFGTQAFFLSGVVTDVQGDAAYLNTLLNEYPPSWYATNDPAVLNAIMNHYIPIDTIVYDLLNCANRNILIDYLLTVNGPALRTQAIATYCTSYLNVLNGLNGGLISALYFLFHGPPPIPVAAMIAWLCSWTPGPPPPPPAPPTFPALEAQINIFDATSNRIAFEGLNTSQLRTIFAAVYPGGIPITIAQLEAIYPAGPLVHCIELADPGLKPWLLSPPSGIPNIQLLNDIKTFDGTTFVDTALSFNRSWASSILCGSGYDMNAFIEMLRTDGSFPGAAYWFWRHWNGTPGNIQDKLTLNEVVMYGSKRLGTMNIDTVVVNSKYYGHTEGNEMKVDTQFAISTLHYDTAIFKRMLGRKQFELNNQVGSAIVTLSDRKMAVDSNADSTIDFFNSDIRNTTETYSFGGPLKNRTYQANLNYKFGYQASLKDDEISYKGKHISTFYREGNSDIPGWLITDPKFNPSESPYMFMSGNPISNNDILGDITDIYTTTGKKITTIKDNLPNQTVFMSVKEYNKLSHKGTYAQQGMAARRASMNYISQRTRDQMGESAVLAEKEGKERPFVLYSEGQSKELKFQDVSSYVDKNGTASRGEDYVDGTAFEKGINEFYFKNSGKVSFLVAIGHTHNYGVNGKTSPSNMFNPSGPNFSNGALVDWRPLLNFKNSNGGYDVGAHPMLIISRVGFTIYQSEKIMSTGQRVFINNKEYSTRPFYDFKGNELK